MVTNNFDLLSSNLVQILQHSAGSQNLCKYLYNDVKAPTTEPDLADTSILLFDKMFPMPFDDQIEMADCSQLRVFYSMGNLENNMVVTETDVIFDIIVAKSLWLINESDGTPSIRPYSITNELVKQFRNQSVGTVGKILFKNFRHIAVDKQFDGVRLVAKMTGFSGGN